MAIFKPENQIIEIMKNIKIIEIYHSILFWGTILQVVLVVLNATHILNYKWGFALLPLWIMVFSTVVVVFIESFDLFKFIGGVLKEIFKNRR